MIRKILLVASEDPKTSSHVRVALDIARRNGASITGFVAVDKDQLSNIGPAPLGGFHYRYEMIKNRVARGLSTAKEAVSGLRKICEANDVPFLAEETTGDRDQSLAQAWRFQDLTVLSDHVWEPGSNEPADAETLLHFVAMGLRPLLVVPQGFEGTPAKAMVGLSGSLDSAKSFKHFVQMRPFGDIPLHIVTVGDPKSGEAPADLLRGAADYARLHGYEVTTAALPKADKRVRALLDHGHSVGAELFIVGSSYHQFLTMTRFGSHALGMLTLSKYPVFVSH
ncbi:universal stress protein [Thalassobaculum salexigens]|uniref:universal stress protein n=1 Tax=Thalassobaculum salexigens TaxID=455360 RepID=UPI000421BFBB|nr:universal stress protein [Thalassobaculum salexigens]